MLETKTTSKHALLKSVALANLSNVPRSKKFERYKYLQIASKQDKKILKCCGKTRVSTKLPTTSCRIETTQGYDYNSVTIKDFMVNIIPKHLLYNLD